MAHEDRSSPPSSIVGGHDVPLDADRTLERIRAQARDGAKARHDRLENVIEQEIVPRLVEAHQADLRRTRGLHHITAAVVRACCDVVQRGTQAEVNAFVGRLHAGGVPLDVLYLDLLAPAAREFGRRWEEDDCSFTDVTLALGRLHQVLREFSDAFAAEAVPRPHGYRALLVPAPGEQHRFGLSMVAEFFRRAGWEVAQDPGQASADTLLGELGRRHYDLIGFSAGCDTPLEALGARIAAARRASRNRRVAVVVGGPACLRERGVAQRVGADACAEDAREAPAEAEALVARLARASGPA